MDCGEVRDLLPEYVLGTLDRSSKARVDRHLAWCAGCRKEAGELAEGAAAVALELPSVEPPPDLEEMVVGRVRDGESGPPRRRAVVLAVAVAAALASASIGWGLGLAGRARPADPRHSARDAIQALESFQDFLVYVWGGGAVETARLRPVGGGPAGGRATLYDSAEQEGDFLVIVVGGLRVDRGPYTVILRSGGPRMEAATLEELGRGQMGAIQEFATEVSGFGSLVVEDAAGRRVLAGSFDT
jgi:hypothetical protein